MIHLDITEPQFPDAGEVAYIVVTGNPIEGFKYYGSPTPFACAEDAVTFGEFLGDEWWVAELKSVMHGEEER